MGSRTVSFTVRAHSLTRVSLVRKRFPLVFTLGIATPLRDRPQVEDEAQKLEGSLRLAAPGRLGGEGHEPCLLLIEAQMIFGEPLPKCPQDALRIPRILATDDGIIRIAIEGDLPCTMPFHHRFEPRIDHVMGEDIGEDGAATTALRYPFLADCQFPRCQARPL